MERRNKKRTRGTEEVAAVVDTIERTADENNMLTDIGPTAGGQFYGSQIPAMGMNIANISSHIQKPGAAMTMVVS